MIPLNEIKQILTNRDPKFIEELAEKSREITNQYFGRTVSLYSPLYISNFCENQCAYCGFNRKYQIIRERLDIDKMHKEMKKISSTGIQQILLLTGESRKMSPLDYIKTAVNIAKIYFSSISIEVYSMDTEEYRELFLTGVDGVTIYQETYDKARYKELHLQGKKTDYNYRFTTPERIAQSGIRAINMGILLGLSEISQDIYHLFTHLAWMEKKYPSVEYSLSFPRLIPLKNSDYDYIEVPDITLIKLICLSRILFPRVGINLSTRERPWIRDHALELGVTKISAASKTGVGGYCAPQSKNTQFEVNDKRTVQEIISMIKNRGFDPVYTEWRHIPNETIQINFPRA